MKKIIVECKYRILRDSEPNEGELVHIILVDDSTAEKYLESINDGKSEIRCRIASRIIAFGYSIRFDRFQILKEFNVEPWELKKP